MQAQRVELRAAQGVAVETQHALIFLAVWFVAALIASRAGWFEDSPAALFIAGLLTPCGAFAAAYHRSERFRAWAVTRNVRTITLLHGLRVTPGAIFLIEYARGTLPGSFALSAAAVDIFAGLTALIAGLTMVDPSGRRPTRGLLIWHLCGLAGFGFLVSLGVLTSPGPLGLLIGHGSSEAMAGWPLSLAPAFLGPVMILLHLIALAGLLERDR